MNEKAQLISRDSPADAERADLSPEKADLSFRGNDVSQQSHRRRNRMLQIAGIASLIFLSGHALLVSHGAIPTWPIAWSDLGRSSSALQDLAFGVQDGYVSAFFMKHHGGDGHRFPQPDQAEAAFLKVPSNSSALAASRSYTAYAHTAGTEGDYKTAVLVKKHWETLLNLKPSKQGANIHDAGSKVSKQLLYGRNNPHHGRHGQTRGDDSVRVWIDKYYVLLNKPTALNATKTCIVLRDSDGNVVHQAKLAEDAVPEDPTSGHGNEDVPPFHGYSKAGSASGQLVYAHFGMREDFARLREAGIDVTGKIVMVRYGGNFRGLKVKAAQEAGAVGVIIYSDPSEDNGITSENGYEAYPKGPARQPSSLQRGSVQYLSQYVGDPTTPGKPSYKHTEREEPTNVPHIPSLPLSYEDAVPLLKALNYHGLCSQDWAGGLSYLGVTYCSGPSTGKVYMYNDVTDGITPIWNTYAVIPGHITDEVILVGNHRDAWVFGASDPNAGTAALFELIKGFGVLLQKGWKPMRTIVSRRGMQAEEYGLVGSTEFGEDHAEWLSHTAVAYLNLDSAVAGSALSVKASPSLADMLHQVTTLCAPPEQPTNETLVIGPLGSGSDYTVFLQHLGVAASDMTYRPHGKDAVYHYHSIYDSEYWMEKYGDPTFKRHVAIAKTLGLATLRLADSLFLPLNVTRYSDELPEYLKALAKLAERLDFAELDLSTVSDGISRIQAAASRLDDETAHINTELHKLHEKRGAMCIGKRMHNIRQLMKTVRNINHRRMNFERGFISAEGLPRRPWYKHLGVSPGEYLGYGATTFPGPTEAMTVAHSMEAAQHEVQRLAQQLNRIAFLLEGSKK